MKCPNKDCKTDCVRKKRRHRRKKKVRQKWENYTRKRLKVNQAGPLDYVFYSIVNTDLHMDQGTIASMITRSLITLYNKLDSDQVQSQYIEKWTNSGEKIIILKGYDHKHLKYLENEAKLAANGTHTLRQYSKRGQIIHVLSVFGQKEDLEDIFEDLPYLR